MTGPERQRAGALDEVRIVDLTTVLMGPLATRILGDHGADVIRVEAPGGDSFSTDESGLSAIALNAQRNKRSVTLDLKSEAGRAAMLDLVASADVLVTNMRAAALDRLGLSAAVLRARHPRLIHCVANGFGETGPYAGRAAYDDAIQASSGLAALHGRVSGTPAYVPSVMADKICALHIVQAVLVALLHQRATGEGQTIQVPMFETMVAFNLVEHYRGAAFDPPKGEVGYPRLLSRNRRPYRCADGWVALLPYTDANWRDFFALIGHPELTDDERFTTHHARIANIDELYAMVAEAAPSRTVAEWLQVCEERSIPASPILDIAELPTDPHLQAVGLFERVDHPALGPYRSVGDPIAYDGLTTDLRHHAPLPGEHTAAIMGELGWDDAGLAMLGVESPPAGGDGADRTSSGGTTLE